MGGLYDNETIRDTFVSSLHHRNRLSQFCKIHSISKSQLLRLFIDELRIDYPDMPLHRKIENNSFRLQSFLGVYDDEPPARSISNAENGMKKRVWFKKVFTHGNCA